MKQRNTAQRLALSLLYARATVSIGEAFKVRVFSERKRHSESDMYEREVTVN